MTSYLYHPLPAFVEKLEHIRREDHTGHERIMKVIERLLNDPANADGKLTGPRRGLLKKYVGRGDYRIIYNWCLACRKANAHLAERCTDCGLVPENSVVFFDLFAKKDHQRLGY